MALFVCLCIACMVTYTSWEISAVQFSPMADDEMKNKEDFSEYPHRDRRKRGILISTAVINGLRAVRALLKDSEPVPLNKKIFQDLRYMYIHEFKKQGDYSKTVDDFYSVNPRDINTYKLPGGVRLCIGVESGKFGQQNLRTVGYVGDRVILMEKSGFYGKQSIEIVQGIGTLKPPRSDLILYSGKTP